MRLSNAVEKLELHFDLKRLRDHLDTKILQVPPVYNGNHFHGWSLQSETGRYQDGWVHGSACYKEVNGQIKFDWQRAKEIGLKPETEYCQRTELVTGYLTEILDELELHGLNPVRSRLICLPPGGATNWHRDHRADFYWVRLHIPIYTNPDCKFITDDGEAHMPADGSAYLVDTSVMHQAFNKGATPRYHFVCQVWDTKCLSEMFPHPDTQIQLY